MITNAIKTLQRGKMPRLLYLIGISSFVGLILLEMFNFTILKPDTNKLPTLTSSIGIGEYSNVHFHHSKLVKIHWKTHIYSGPPIQKRINTEQKTNIETNNEQQTATKQSNTHQHTIAPGAFQDKDGNKLVLEVALECRTKGWCGIGFGSLSMYNSDQWRGYVNDSTGKVEFLDTWSYSKMIPTPDDKQPGCSNDILAVAGSQNGDYTTLKFLRFFQTGDTACDYQISTDPNARTQVSYAICPFDKFESQHSDVNMALIYFASADPSPHLKIDRHAILLLVSIVISFIGIVLLAKMGRVNVRDKHDRFS